MRGDLDDIRDLLNDKLNTHQAAQAASKAARIDKDATRHDAEVMVRSFRNISKAGGVNEANMAALGIPVTDSTAPATATFPIGMIDTSHRMRHTISWTDGAAPENKRRPRGAM